MDAYLTDIVNRISTAIEAEPDHDKRHKLKRARELVRDAMWGTDVALGDLPEDTRYPPVVFGPEAIAQLRAMAAKPVPDWLQRLIDEREAIAMATEIPGVSTP